MNNSWINTNFIIFLPKLNCQVSPYYCEKCHHTTEGLVLTATVNYFEQPYKNYRNWIKIAYIFLKTSFQSITDPLVSIPNTLRRFVTEIMPSENVRKGSPFLYPLKSSQNHLWFSDVCRWYRNVDAFILLEKLQKM